MCSNVMSGYDKYACALVVKTKATAVYEGWVLYQFYYQFLSRNIIITKIWKKLQLKIAYLALCL